MGLIIIIATVTIDAKSLQDYKEEEKQGTE